jgi:hypothetical protein
MTDRYNRLARIRQILPILMACTVSIMLMLLDWPLGYAREEYLNHPLLTGVLSSLIPIVIGATLVKAYIDHRENARWRVASKVAYNSLLRAPLAQRRVMWFLLCGGPIVEDRDFAFEAKYAARITKLLRHNHMKERSEASSFMEGRPDLEARLARLVTSSSSVVTCVM